MRFTNRHVFALSIGCGVGMTLLTVVSTFWLWRGTLYNKRWLLWIFVASIIPAIVGNETGWVAAEVGRQPWIVHAPLKVDETRGVPFILSYTAVVYWTFRHPIEMES